MPSPPKLKSPQKSHIWNCATFSTELALVIFSKRRFGLKFSDTIIKQLEKSLKTSLKVIDDDVFQKEIPQHYLKYNDYPWLNHVSVKLLETQAEIEKNGILTARKKYAESYNDLKVKSPSVHPVIKAYQNKVIATSTRAMNDWLKLKLKTKSGPKPIGFEEIIALGADKAVALAMPHIHRGVEKAHTMQKVCIGIGHAIQDQLFIIEARRKDRELNGDSSFTSRVLNDSKESGTYLYRSRYVKRRLHHNDLIADITKWDNTKAAEIGGVVVDCVYETGEYIDFRKEKNQVVTFKSKAKDKKTGFTKPKEKKWLVFKDEVKLFLDRNNAYLQFEDFTYPIMVIPPRPWTDENTGAFLTNHVRDKFGLVITRKQSQAKAIREQRKAGKLDGLLNTVNKIQSTHYDMSPFMHKVLKYCQVKKIPYLNKPMENIVPISVEEYADINGLSFDKSEWDKQDTRRFNAHRKGQYRLQHEIEMQRMQFEKDHETSLFILELGTGLWIPFCLDWRMRMYCGSYFSYQRDDAMKSRFVFRIKKRLGVNGLNQLKRQVATFYGNGIDKVRISNRIQWTDDNYDLIKKTVDNWKTDKFWLEADEPCQFLQNCKELVDAIETGNPEAFESNLIIWNDASNSGLQQYSMERRDAVGAKDTNMTILPKDQVKSNDFYIKIRDAVEDKIKNTKWENEYDKTAAKQWLKFGIKRGDVKTPAFTYFYNSREWGMQDEVLDKTMSPLNVKMYSEKNFKHPFGGYQGSINAARFMGSIIYNLVGDYAPAANEAMKFILEITGILSDFDINLKIINPSGFPMVQAYEQPNPKPKTIRIPMYDFSFKVRHKKGVHDHQLKIASTIPNTVYKTDSENGSCPNIVHSYDASQLDLAVQDATHSENPNRISHVAVNHDCVGTHACDADEFVKSYKFAGIHMYSENSFLEQVYNYAKECIGEEFTHPITGKEMKLPPIPTKLGWDIEEYYDSELSIS